MIIRGASGDPAKVVHALQERIKELKTKLAGVGEARSIEQISSGGGTNVYAGLELALDDVDADRVTSLVLVTDGENLYLYQMAFDKELNDVTAPRASNLVTERPAGT